MPTFHVQGPDGQEYDIEGENMQGAVAALKKMQAGAAGLATPGGGLQVPEAPLSGAETAKGAARAFVGGVPIAGPSLEHDLPAALSSAMGSGTFEENKVAGKQAQAEFERRFPGGSTALGIAGGAASTLPAMAVAPALFGGTGLSPAANMAAGGAGGAAIGAADAWARGQNPLVGGAVGGVAGGVAPGLAKGLGATAEAVGNKLLGAGLPPELQGINRKALEWASKLAKADGLTDAEITAKFQRLGPEGFLAEYGPNLRSGAGFVAARPGTGKAEIFGGMEERQGGTHGRIEQAFNDTIGDRYNLPRTIKEVAQQRSADSRAPYERAMNTPIDYDPRLQQFVNDPLFKQAMKSGFEVERLDALAEGRKFEPLRYAITGVDHAGMPILAGVPNMRTLDMAKKGLDGILDTPAARDELTGRLTQYGNAVNSVRKAFVSHLDSINPDYATARQSWEGPTKMIKAMDSGRQALGRNLSADEMREEVGGMNQSEKQAYLIGLRGELARITDASTRGDTTARDLMRSRAAQDKLETLIGPDKTKQLLGAMEREATFAETHSKTMHNSETAARSAVSEMMTPDPKDTFIHRIREKYSPHVTPGGLIPRVFEQRAAERQAQKFEEARNEIAPILMRQGGDAERMARALIGYQPGGNISPTVERYANALLQGLAPAERRKMMELVQ